MGKWKIANILELANFRAKRITIWDLGLLLHENVEGHHFESF